MLTDLDHEGKTTMKETPQLRFGGPGQSLERSGQELLENLPELARIVIEDRPENDNFKQNPDDPEEHDPKWHQFGIITHTRKFSEFYQTKAREYFRELGTEKYIDEQLSKQIDGKTKEELLRISIPLHDVGKFARGFKDKKGKLMPDYNGHWEKSEKLIMENEQIRNLLQETYGLADSQVAYIAKCAGLHYELGKVRDEVQETGRRYTIAFLGSERCKEACSRIVGKFPEFRQEIGLMFLGDSLAKTDIPVDAKTDQDIEDRTHEIERIIQERGLKAQLKAAVKERPVNITLAEMYLKLANKSW